MFTINGATSLTQWEQGITLLNAHMQEGDAVRFVNEDGLSGTMTAYLLDGTVVVEIPNRLLQYDAVLTACIAYTEDRTVFEVQTATKPSDYAYIDNEVNEGEVLPITKGGTGATTANEARENLGAMGNSGLQELTNGTLRVMDKKNVGNGFAVRRFLSSMTRGLAAFIGTAGQLILRLTSIADDGTSTTLNHLTLTETDSQLGKPLTTSSGGTGQTYTYTALGYEFNSAYGTVYTINIRKYPYLRMAFVRIGYTLNTSLSANTIYKLCTVDADSAPQYVTALAAYGASMLNAYINSSGEICVAGDASNASGTTIRVAGWWIMK